MKYPFSKLNITDYIGQLFIIELHNKNRIPFTEYNSALDKIIVSYKPGGFIFFKKNIKTKLQLKKLIRSIKQNSKIKSFISIDEEGEPITRLNNILKVKYPSNKTLAKINNPAVTKKTAFSMGAELKELGFNLNFAPVVDVLKTKKTEMIGERSFGDNINIVERHSSAFYKGLEEAKIISCIKHFPNCGVANKDLHYEQTIIDIDIKTLINHNCAHYQSLIEQNCPIIMVEHSCYSKISDQKKRLGENIILPASLSKNIITDILINKFKFNNIVITDSLRMKSISEHFTYKQIIRYGLEAGINVFLMLEVKDFFKAFDYIKNYLVYTKKYYPLIKNSILKILKIKGAYL